MSEDKVKMRSEARRRRLLRNNENRMKRILGDQLITASRDDCTTELIPQEQNFNFQETTPDLVKPQSNHLNHIHLKNDTNNISDESKFEEPKPDPLTNHLNNSEVNTDTTTVPTVKHVQPDTSKTQASLLSMSSGFFVCICFLILNPQDISFAFGYIITEVIIAVLYPNCFVGQGNFLKAVCAFFLVKLGFEQDFSRKLTQIFSILQIGSTTTTTCHTCITCHVAFADANLQRMHYKCDWHRYNLKRKVVALPPITRESFNEKVAAQKAQIASTKSKENIVGFSCKVCQRKFNSFNSYENHLKSKKHQEAEGKEMEIVRKKLQQEDKTEDKDFNSDEESDKQIVLDKAISVARSNLQQPNIISTDAPKPTKKFNRDDNPRLRWYRKQVRAMEEKERNKEEERSDGSGEEWEDISDDDVTIGESSDEEISSQSESTCTDASSLVGVMSRVKLDSDADIESLASQGNRTQKMIGSKECLFCCKRSSSVERNVAHMSRIHGFFIPELQYLTDLEGLLSYLGEKVGVGNVCLWCNEHGHAFYSLKAVQAHMKDKGHMKMLSHGDASLEYADFYNFSASYPDLDSDNEDEELPHVDVDEGDDEDSELVLPSGARIGHRSLMRYYRQNFPPIERVKQRAGRIDQLMHQYRAIGWKGGAGTVAGKKFERDMKFVQRMKSKFVQKLGTNNNKTMMKHLRPQVVF